MFQPAIKEKACAEQASFSLLFVIILIILAGITFNAFCPVYANIKTWRGIADRKVHITLKARAKPLAATIIL